MYSRVKIEILGNNPDYFLKELIKIGINYYDLEKYFKKIILIIDYSDYERIKELKTTYKIHIIRRYGLNKFIYYFKRFYLLILFLGLGIILNIILANIVFKIEVVHSNKNIRELVIKDLEELGIKRYHFKVSYKEKELIKKKIKEKEEIIDWIEIDEVGTKYIVKVEEKKINKIKEKCQPRNIIAKKNALIMDIDAISGEVKKSTNNYVNKGEVIISGFIYNKDKVVSKRCAEGKVYGETWYLLKISVPRYQKKEKLLNKSSLGIEIKLLNKNYNSSKIHGSFHKNMYNLIGSDFIPIKYSINRYQKTNVFYIEKTSKELKKEIYQAVQKEMKKRLNRDERVLKKKILKKTTNNSKIEVEVFASVKENITSYQDITKINPEEMNKKEE